MPCTGMGTCSALRVWLRMQGGGAGTWAGVARETEARRMCVQGSGAGDTGETDPRSPTGGTLRAIH